MKTMNVQQRNRPRNPSRRKLKTMRTKTLTMTKMSVLQRNRVKSPLRKRLKRILTTMMKTKSLPRSQ
jgi:hypothetical protein